MVDQLPEQMLPVSEIHRLVRRSSLAVVEPNRIPADLCEELDIRLIVPESFEEQTDLFPGLVDLRALREVQREMLFEHVAAWESTAPTPYFSALLMTECSPVQVATHLARRMVLTLPGGRVDVLRYYDPHVFRHLRWLLTENQLDSLLGPVRGWGWREPTGEWLVHARTLGHASVAPLMLDAAQWPDLLQVAEVNAVLIDLARTRPNFENDAMAAQQVNGFLTQARKKYGLTHRDDRRLFARQAMTAHPRIHEHARLAERLTNCRDRGLRFTESCTDLNESVLIEMSRDLEETRSGVL